MKTMLCGLQIPVECILFDRSTINLFNHLFVTHTDTGKQLHAQRKPHTHTKCRIEIEFKLNKFDDS